MFTLIKTPSVAAPTARPPYVVVTDVGQGGGLATHTIPWIKALLSRGHAVSVVQTHKAIFETWLAGLDVKVVHHPLAEYGSASQQYRAWRAMIRPYAGARIVMCRSSGRPIQLPVLLALRQQGSSIFVIYHSMGALHEPRGACGSFAHSGDENSLDKIGPVSIQGIKLGLVNALIRRRITVSDAARQTYVHLHGASTENFSVCYPGLNLDQFQPDETARRRDRAAEGWAEDHLVVGYVGRMSCEKRPDLLVRGFAQFLRQTSRTTTLALVGRGPMDDPLRNLVRELAIENHVRFINWTDDAARWHRLTDVEVIPSITENIGLSAAEAMCCGTLVLASDVGGLGEYMVHGQNGFLVPMHQPDDVTKWLSNIASLDPDTANRIRAEAHRSAAERFDQRRRLPELLNALDAEESKV